MIELRKIRKSFDGRASTTALCDVDLTVHKGEMVAIVGPSGSGKSTLLNLVGTLDRPTAGDIYIDGLYLNELSDDDLTYLRRDKIGFVFQFFNLLPLLSALQNVCIPLYLRGWSRIDAEARARELLRRVQLEQKENHLPDELSGGERQRVAIARALSIYPPILLADEPTGNLDTHTGTEIVRLITGMQNDLRTTVLIVTHNLEVSKGCNRTIQLRDGRIVED